MMDGLSSSKMVDVFQKMTTNLQDIHFPLKRITVSPYDKPWITEELKMIRRRRQRIYRKQGRSPAYLQLKKEFNDKLENESTKYMNKIYEEVSNGKRGSSYSAIRKLGNREFEQSSSTFDVPEFVDDNLDEKQSDEALAEYFSSISQEFMPLDPDNLPSKVKIELEKGIVEKNLPILNEYEVYEKVTRAKKPQTTVPGDLKRTLVKECSVELITPVTKIYNEITRSFHVPG